MAQGNKPQTKRIVAEIPTELFTSVRVEASIRDTTMTDIVTEALSEWLSAHAESEYFASVSEEQANG